jgi:hypothetical protein
VHDRAHRPAQGDRWGSASTASREVVRASIEYPTIRFVQASLIAQRQSSPSAVGCSVMSVSHNPFGAPGAEAAGHQVVVDRRPGPAAGAACSVLRGRQRDDLETRVRSQSLRRLARQARALTADAKTIEGDLQRLTADTSRSSSRSPGSARSSPGLRGAKGRTPASRTSQ